MNIVYIFADSPAEMNTSIWRCFIPERVLREHGHNTSSFHYTDFTVNGEAVQKACNESDIIIIERNLFGDVLTLMQYWKSRGKVVCANFDDAYGLMPPEVSTYRFWVENKNAVTNDKGEERLVDIYPRPIKQLTWGVQMASATFLPSKQLVKDWKDVGNPVYLPNYYDEKLFENIKLTTHKGLIIGWGGSLSHLQSFKDSGIIRAIENIVAKRDDVRLMICGDKRVYESFSLPENKKLYQSYVPFETWPSIIERIDIALVPLCGEYDQRRSWIKPLEFMRMGKPFIASDNDAYEQFRGVGIGKYVKNTYLDWKRAINEYVDNYAMVKDQAQQYIEYAKKFAMQNNVDKVIATYKKVIEEEHAK